MNTDEHRGPDLEYHSRMQRRTLFVRSASAWALALAVGVSSAACHPQPLSSAPGEATARRWPEGLQGLQRPVVVGPAGRVLVTFEDKLSTSFRLQTVLFGVDADPLLICRGGGRTLDAAAPIVVYDGDLSAGSHELRVELEYRGDGAGIFSYLQGYRFEVRGAHAFELQDAQFLSLHVTAWEQGSAETALEDRPQLRFEDRSTQPVHGVILEGCPWAE